jgi:hypothetical protein
MRRYENMAKLKSHRDATKGILGHTWDLLEDVLQLAILHGGVVGRTRSRHMETLMKVSLPFQIMYLPSLVSAA